MNHWIFQGNPNDFDISSYLRDHNKVIWAIRQDNFVEKTNEKQPDKMDDNKKNKKFVKKGDEVFFWQAAGNNKGNSGVIAIAQVLSDPNEMEDDPVTHDYWQNKSNADSKSNRFRVTLKIAERKLNPDEMLKRSRIKQDDLLQGLQILKMSSQTNYHISAEQAERLTMLFRSNGSIPNIKD